MPEEDFSHSESSPEPPTKAPSRKRKPAASGGTSKKAKVASGSSANSGVLNKQLSDLASSVIANGVEFYNDEENQEVGAEAAVKLAEYTKQLETALAQTKSSGGAPAAKQKTRAELEAAAEKIRRTAVSGITKQMTWKPSCKTNSAKWLYDGLCADANVFGIVMGLDGPPTWKMKKVTKEDFEDLFGSISASVRYDNLNITGTHVNVRWNSDSGEFKFSGSYGKGY